MTIPFTTKKASGVFVKVPEDVREYYITANTWLEWKTKTFPHFHEIRLPEGNFEILGIRTKTETLAEEQAHQIIECITLAYPFYRNYLIPDCNFQECFHKTAIESFHSLMDSLECWVDNPIPHPLSIDPTWKEYYDKVVKEWRDAENKTGNWLIVIKK